MRKCSNIIAFCILFILLGLLAFASVSITMKTGLSSADDGFFALASKALSNGVYGLPLSSGEVYRFDPSIGSGPFLLGLGAVITRIIGPSDFLGVSIVVVFIVQLVLLLLILRRNFELSAVLNFAFVGVFLIILASKNHWYFSTFIGEVPAFGFVLVGGGLLSAANTRAWLVLAGLAFSAAYLTKQITLFAVVGIMLTWIISEGKGRGARAVLKDFCIIAAAMVFLPIVFEIVKLISLGYASYTELWAQAAKETSKMALAILDRRLELFFEIVGRDYGAFHVLIALFLLLGGMFAWQCVRRSNASFGLMLYSGAFSYLLYIGTLSTMWPRYFWIGVGLMAFALASSLLAASSRVRLLVIFSLIIVGGFPAYTNTSKIVQQSAETELAGERKELLGRLVGSSTPLVGRSWHSFYDIVYLMESNRRWVSEGGLGLIDGREFMAVLNSAYGDEGRFFYSVTNNCQREFAGKRYSLYSCGSKFWGSYNG